MTDIRHVLIADAEGRKSIKYKFSFEGQTDLLDFVFASDPRDAEKKIREEWDVPEATAITIVRVNENAHGHLGTGRKQLAAAGFSGVTPSPKTQTMEMITT